MSEHVGNSNIIMNAALIELPDQDVDVYVTPFTDADSLKEIRSTYSDNYAVLRRGDSVVLLPLRSELSPLQLPIEKRNLREDLGLFAEATRKAIANKVRGLGRIVYGRDPISFLSESDSENLLAIAAGTTKVPNWLSIRPLIEIVIRPIRTARTTELVFIVDVRTTQQITLPCSELVDQGMVLSGLYVGDVLNETGKVRNLGRIASINGKHAVLSDCREGFETVALESVVLIPDRTSFERTLLFASGTSASIIQPKLRKILAKFRSGPERLRKLESIRKYFAGASLEVLPGATLKLSNFVAGHDPLLKRLSEAPRPTYVFDPSGRKTDTWHDRGLDVNGPYSAQTFTPNQPNICVICQASRKGQVEQFVKKFLDGVDSGKPKDRFKKGLIRKYALNTARTDFFTARDNSPAAYQEAAKAAIEQSTDKSIKWDLALIQIDEQFHELAGDANPYLATKAMLLSQQVPTQAFEIETASVSDYQAGFILNNMALATYAKLGGVPWLLKANPAIAHELVIGLGSASIGEGRLGKRERVVGITTVFSGDGNYWLQNLSQAVPFANYREALVSSLQRTVSRVRTSMNWQKRDQVRLVFHGFKPIKGEDADAVFEVVRDLSEFDVEVAFLHVVENHQFQIFDKGQSGVQDYATGATKGTWAVKRGQILPLNDHETLLVLTGPTDLKTSEQGLPKPVLLRLDKRSTFRDMTYLSRQVYAFANHSWRSFFPASMPVSIMYSDLVASLLGNLSTVSKWNADVMLGRIGTTRWFL
jgi:hypothetical protein